MLFGFDFAVELVLIEFFLGENFVAPGLEFAEAPIQPLGLATVKPHRRARQVLQETPVMTDEHECAAAARQFAFQPFNRRQIEVVGWLVEQQDVRGGGKCARECRAARLTAGQT